MDKVTLSLAQWRQLKFGGEVIVGAESNEYSLVGSTIKAADLRGLLEGEESLELEAYDLGNRQFTPILAGLDLAGAVWKSNTGGWLFTCSADSYASALAQAKAAAPGASMLPSDIRSVSLANQADIAWYKSMSGAH